MKLIVESILIVAMSLGLVACPSVPTYKVTDFPPARLAWPAVEQDFLFGISDGESEGDISLEESEVMRDHAKDMGDALRISSKEALQLVPWPAMHPWAKRGIKAQLAEGRLGEGSAASLREQLSQFNETIERIRSR